MGVRVIASRRVFAAFISLVMFAVLTMGGAASAAAGASSPSAAVQQASLKLLQGEIAADAGAYGPYRNGFWESQNTICWSCNQGGPATATATLYMLTGRSRPQLLQEAEGTIDTAIATRQQPSGAFVAPTGDTQSPDVATMFFGDEEANAYLELRPALDAAHAARWRASIAAAASYLIHNGNLNWYTNGNINLGNAELFYLAWRATGNPLFHAAYHQAWSFALSPPQSQWPGRGLIVVKAPTRADGSDGAGYLTETGAGGTGFDPEYTSLQLDVAARMYLLTGDPRALRLANLLVNMLLPRINSSYMLDTSNGTRHTEPVRSVPLLTSAFAVLALDGGRQDLLPDLTGQFSAISSTFQAPWNAYSEVFRRALGTDISVIALAGQAASPVGWATRTGFSFGAHPPIVASRPAATPASARVRRRASERTRGHVARRHRRAGRRRRAVIVARHRRPHSN